MNKPTLIKELDLRDASGCKIGLFRCNYKGCANEFQTTIIYIKNNRIKSCGCLQKEKAKETCIKRNTTHNASYTKEFRIWVKIKERCYGDYCKEYKYYGSRGIIMCDRWLNSFENFLEDMGKRPSDKHTIDRIDNNGNYTPENCKWSTMKEQCRNRRNNHFLLFNNELKTISEWSEITGLSISAINGRIKRGWVMEEMLTIPPRGIRHK